MTMDFDQELPSPGRGRETRQNQPAAARAKTMPREPQPVAGTRPGENGAAGRGAAKNSLAGTLRVSVEAGECGPLITVAGEADVTTAAQLADVITAQLATGTLYLTVDTAELSFADSMTISILTGAARSLKELGGGLVLLRPQSHLTRILAILGADQVLTIHGATDLPPGHEGGIEDSP
ncbi:STAS domain-containing protein [Trebonia kvetii]|nr:STAS domain-containing protein [Trebonia kvetii]